MVRWYVYIQDLNTSCSSSDGFYHIEKVFKNEDVQRILDTTDFRKQDVFIISNDDILLSKYSVVISENNFEKMCIIQNDLKRSQFNPTCLEYFKQIKSDELISASNLDITIYEMYKNMPHFPPKTKNNWLENKEFKFLKTPFAYKQEFLVDPFQFAIMATESLRSLNKSFNLKLTRTDDLNKLSEYGFQIRKNILKYYDPITRKRLYVKIEDFLEFIKNHKLNLAIDISIDNNFYIEYHVRCVYKLPRNNNYFRDDIYEDSDDFDFGQDHFIDEAIKSAFEGDANNMWNID